MQKLTGAKVCMEIHERLLLARNHLNYSQDEIASLIGSKKRGYQENERGNSFPGGKVLEGFVNLGVNANWLLTGAGEMMLSKGDPTQSSLSELTEFALIPGYNIQISAGNGSESEKEQVTRKLAFRHRWLKYKGLNEKDLVLVFTKGDSMEPTISDNNTLMIDTSQTQLQDGHIYVIRTNDHLVVKRVQNTLNGFYLISDNKEYKEIELTYNEADDLQVIGRVVWIGKDL